MKRRGLLDFCTKSVVGCDYNYILPQNILYLSPILNLVEA